jgi:hypothetical protein
MKIDVKAKNEEGELIFEGTLNRREVGFLLQYAVNDLMVAGVEFNLQEPDDDDDEPLRMTFPKMGEFND